jgi:mono/diheme cytochrome c family protein
VYGLVALLFTTIALTACGRREEVPTEVRRLRDPAFVAQGAVLYQTHCARCHGAAAEGATEWRRRDAEGFFPPPPLDESAHAWHHPLADLRRTIRHGSLPGQGRMPGWGGRLNDTEVDAVIAWFQSTWSPEVYAAWLEIDQRARRN